MEEARNGITLDDTDANQMNRKPKLTPIIVLPTNPQMVNKVDECTGFQSNGRLNVQYVSVAYHDSHFMNGIRNDVSLVSSKTESSMSEVDKKCFNGSLENVSNLSDSEASVGKHASSQLSNQQRLLISPTDFLSLSEEISRSSAVKRDVNLSTSCLEILRRNENSAIGLDRYCESPFLLETHRESQLISDDDDTSNNGRVSSLSESHEDLTDDLFSTTLTDQHSTLREVVVTPIDSESSRATPVSKEFIRYINNHEGSIIKEERLESEEEDCKSNLTLLNPVDNQHEEELTSTVNTANAKVGTSSILSTISEGSTTTPTTPNCVAMALPVTPLDIKILPTGLLQLAANIAAVFPSSTMQKQVALQLLREDGTSIIVPITTRSSDAMPDISSPISNSTDSNNPPDSATSSNVLNGEAAHNQEADRPFKCELCNSTFTRLGNYTRHKKIHSLPSKEDQRFRCDICGKSFIQRCDLARHLHIHRGTEPHRCSQCGKGYIRHSDLVTHQRFHNKEKPFACPHCSKGFCQRGDLNRHLRSIHLQLKPILCSHCHKKFAKEETLLRHVNANHRDKLTVN